jgi:hypothetical protein
MGHLSLAQPAMQEQWRCSLMLQVLTLHTNVVFRS